VIDEVNIDSSAKELRKFGITMTVAFAVIATITILNDKSIYPVFLVLSGVFGFLGLLQLGLLKYVHKWWMVLAHIMGHIITTLILAVLFYFILTPIGFVIKVCGKDIFDLKFARNEKNILEL